MANVRISQLPTAPEPIDGSELVPIVQNGQTVQTTVNDLISSPSLTQTFLTKVQEPSLPNSRYLGVGAGLGITDAGAQNLLQISPAGALASLVNSSAGIQVKTAAATLTNRSIATSGNGLSISNGSGVSGDPTVSLAGLALALANTVGTGILNVRSSSTVNLLTITGTSDQITVADGAGASGNPTISIANNPIIPGSAALRVPTGTTAQRPGTPGNGDIRYNTDTGLFEGYLNGSWTEFAAGSGVTSIATGTGLTGGPITSTGTISIANTGVSAATYGSASSVPVVAVNAQGQITSATNTAISIASSAITDKGLANGVASLDGSGTVPVSQLPAAVLGALKYQGTWNASTNTPTLTSSVGTQGYYYVVSVAGSTDLNGITDWKIGDWAIYSGTAWQKIDNTDAVTSVNGYTGTVVLTYTDVGAQQAGTAVTSVSATSPVASSGGLTPTISMPAATTSVSGYLTSTDWTTFNNKGSGSVTSVSGTGTVNGLTLSGTVTTTGSLTLGGTLDLSSPPAIGGMTPAAITGTTITASNYVGISGGTF